MEQMMASTDSVPVAPAAAPTQAAAVSTDAAPAADPAVIAATAARNQAAMRSQKLYDQALNWLKVGGSYEKVHGLLVESHALASQVFGEVDLKTARIGWQLASLLLTKGSVEEAEPLLLSVQRVRERLLPETSDELFDVFTDLSYVHLFRAQHPSHAPPAVAPSSSSSKKKKTGPSKEAELGASKKHTGASKESEPPASSSSKQAYDTAMSYALRAKAIVLQNANSSTSERYHYRLCLISSRIGGILRQQAGMGERARASYEEAYANSSRLQLDSEKNVKLHVHACLELAGIDMHLRQVRRVAAAAEAKKHKRTPTKGEDAAAAATATAAASTVAFSPAGAASTPSVVGPRDASSLYQKVIALLPQHNLHEQPFMAQAQAGLALLLMAEAEEMHQEAVAKTTPPSSANSAAAVSAETTAAAAASPASAVAPTTSSATALTDAASSTAAASSSATAAAAPTETIAVASVPPLTAHQRHAQIQSLLHRAVQLTTDALALYQTIGGEHSLDVATMCYNLGSLHVRLGAPQSARPFLSRALLIRTKLAGPHHESVARVRDDLAKLGKIAHHTATANVAAFPPGPSGSQTARAAPRPAPPSQPPTPGALSARRRAAGGVTSRRGTAPNAATPAAGLPPPLLPAAAAANLAARSGRSMSSGVPSARGTAAAAVKAFKTAKTPSTPTTNIESTDAPAISAAAVAAAQLAPTATESSAASMPTKLRKAPSQSKLLTFPAPAAAERTTTSAESMSSTVAPAPAEACSPPPAVSLGVASVPTSSAAPRSMSRSGSSSKIVIPARHASGGALLHAASSAAVPAPTGSTSTPAPFAPVPVALATPTAEQVDVTSTDAPTISLPPSSPAASVASIVSPSPTFGAPVASTASKTYVLQRAPSNANLDPTPVASPLAAAIPTASRPSSVVYRIQLRPTAAQQQQVAMPLGPGVAALPPAEAIQTKSAVPTPAAEKLEESKQQAIEVNRQPPTPAPAVISSCSAPSSLILAAAAAGIHYDPRLLSF